MQISNVKLDEIANAEYTRYAVAVNEDRSVPSCLDGLKPVSRRGIWTLYQLKAFSNSPHEKSARFVGHTLGYFHPHGDVSCYESYATMVNSIFPLVDGDGSWGNLSDPQPAAMRYTQMRMSQFSELVYFNKFYIPAIQYVQNYDGSQQEPLILPALLPVLLLNGTFGVGVGVTAKIPSFSLASLIPVLKKTFKTGKCTPYDCMGLKYTRLYGGELASTKESLKSFYEKGTGSVRFISSGELDEEKKTLLITKFAFNSSLEPYLKKTLDLPFVTSVNDVSDVNKNNLVSPRVLVKFNSKSLSELREHSRKILETVFGVAQSFDIRVVERYVSPRGEGAAHLGSTNIPGVIETWCKFRVDLEKRACTYWIGENKKEIENTELLMTAVKFRRVIIDALDKPFNDAQLAEHLSKALKLTIEQANYILDLKIRRLKSLEMKDLIKKKSDLENERKDLISRYKNPIPHIYANMDLILASVTKRLPKV